MATIIKWEQAATDATITISGTSGSRYVVGVPRNPTLYGGAVQGRYILSGTATYRWVVDEPLAAGTATTVGYTYDIV